MTEPDETAVRELYAAILAGWNARDAPAFAAPFADDGTVIGFDGSEEHGRAAIEAAMGAIFADHETGAYVAKVRGVRPLRDGAAVLRAVIGMVPAGADDLEPGLNAAQTLVAERGDAGWRVVLFQNTPAQYHGRPELTERLTEELRAVRSGRG